MGAYSINSNRPFKSNGNINRRRKRNNVLDRNRELIRNSKLKIDEKNESIIIIRKKND